jgi:hypothetical protein
MSFNQSISQPVSNGKGQRVASSIAKRLAALVLETPLMQ